MMLQMETATIKAIIAKSGLIAVSARKIQLTCSGIAGLRVSNAKVLKMSGFLVKTLFFYFLST